MMNMNIVPPWLDTFLLVWFILTGLSVLYVAWDAFTKNPELKVMKWGWILVTAYTGPIGAALYVLSCKEPKKGMHEKFTAPLWKQSLGTALLGLPMWIDTISEYFFGFVFALFIFQALFMKDMLGGSYWQALKSSFYPEWVSMSTVMAGMIPVMVILMSSDMLSMEPTSLRYWGIMSLAVLVGTATAFPVNMWLVSKGFKEGMGTMRVFGKGGTPLMNKM
jgi:hypothetical protein